MFDGIKIMRLSTNPEVFLNNSRLVFHGVHKLATMQELPQYKRFANYNGFNFRLHGNQNQWDRLEMRGSIHKFVNLGRHNHNDFTRIRLAEAIESMRVELDIHPFKDILNNIEFGVNLKLNVKPQVILESLLTYKGVPFENRSDDYPYYQCKTSQFIIKIYDKGSQFGLSSNILRFEIKVLKMDYLKTKKLKLHHLADLLHTDNCLKLGRLLFNTFDDILFRAQSISEEKLPESKKDLYLRGGLSSYWKRPKLSDFSSKSEYQKFSKAKIRQENEYRKLFTPTYLHFLRASLESKWGDLTRLELEEEKRIERLLYIWAKDCCQPIYVSN